MVITAQLFGDEITSWPSVYLLGREEKACKKRPWGALVNIIQTFQIKMVKRESVENTSLDKFVGFEIFTFFFQKHTAPKARWLTFHINRIWVICFTQAEKKIFRCSSSHNSLRSIHSPIYSIQSNILLRSPSAYCGFCSNSSMHTCINCKGRLERYWNGLVQIEEKVGVGDCMGDTP